MAFAQSAQMDDVSTNSTTSVPFNKKVSCVRWSPMVRRTPVFAVGSWGDQTNRIALYSLSAIPQQHVIIPHKGDVTSLAFLDDKGQTLLATSSNGSLSLHDASIAEAQPRQQALAKVEERPSALQIVSDHKRAALCVAVERTANMIVSGGQDGALHVYQGAQGGQLRRVRSFASSASAYSVDCAGVSQFVSVGMSATMLVWDVRSKATSASCKCMDPHARTLTCVSVHPSMPHIVATGSRNGLLSFWDIRKFSTPISTLKAHEASVLDIAFLQPPSCVVSCSESGDVVNWDFNKDRRDPTQVSFTSNQQDNIRATTLLQEDLAINSVHSNPDTQWLLWGGDGESITLSHRPYAYA